MKPCDWPRFPVYSGQTWDWKAEASFFYRLREKAQGAGRSGGGQRLHFLLSNQTKAGCLWSGFIHSHHPPSEGSIVSNEQETQWHSARRHRILYTLLDHRVLFKSLFVHEWIDLPVVAPPLDFYCRQNYFPSPPTHGLQSTVCFKLNGCIFITACTVQIIPSKDFWRL